MHKKLLVLIFTLEVTNWWISLGLYLLSLLAQTAWSQPGDG